MMCLDLLVSAILEGPDDESDGFVIRLQFNEANFARAFCHGDVASPINGDCAAVFAKL